MGIGPRSNAQSTRMLLPAAVAVATAAFSLVSAHDAAAQGFNRFGLARGGGPGASHSMMLPKSGMQKLRPGMVKGGSGKHTGGRVTGPGRIADTGPTHPKRPPKHPKGKRPKPGILIPGGTIPPVIAVVPPTGGGGSGGGTPPGIGGSGQPASGNPPAIARSGATIPSAGQRYVPDEVVIEVAASTSAQALLALARRHRLLRVDALPLRSGGSTLLRWRIPDRRPVAAVVRALGTESIVVAVQANYLATLQEAPQTVAVGTDAPLEQYSLEKLRLPQAHALATGNKVLIAIIDSGVDTSHPELAGMVADSFDAIGSGDRVHPHGTAIAGAIVARARLKGAAPAAQILAIRAFGAHRGSNDGTSFHIIKGLDWALGRGARIVNMSFAGDNDPAVSRRLAELRARGVVLIAAAGNAGPNSKPLFPAADANVIAVTATDEDDKVFRAANRGRHIAVAAPGVDLLLPAPGGEYKMTSGTSFAAAHVSGAAALMLERNAALDPAAVRRALIATARDLGPKGSDPQFGAGLVDAYRAILSVSQAGEARADAAVPAAVRK
jgi:subtilisin family serine protease